MGWLLVGKGPQMDWVRRVGVVGIQTSVVAARIHRRQEERQELQVAVQLSV